MSRLALIAILLALMTESALAIIGRPVAFIRVEGTQRVERETVLSYTIIKPGMTDEVGLVDRSIKALFASGLFADVTIRREGAGLVIVVVENPIVNRVVYEGNSAINDENLGNEGGLKARQIYTRAKVQDDVERFIEIYRLSGRFAVRIEPKVIQLPQNRVDLIFEINEGPVTGVRSINFVGNKAFSDARLRDEILTTESRWWRFFTSHDGYDPDRIAYDRDLLRRFYLSRGYADFRVVSVNAELTRNGERFFITFTVDEGERYDFGEAGISTTLTNIDIVSFEEEIVHEEGDVYDSRTTEATVDALIKKVGELGYAFADVRPQPTRDEENRLIKVEYVIEEGPRVYVERININGNTRTLDDVIRRKVRLAEGDAFNRVLLSRSERDIRGLGFFSNVQATESPGSTSDQTIIDINVAEQPTGELNFGIGYSSVSNATFDFSVAERNFLGRGQQLRLQLSASRETQHYEVGFTEPSFLGRDLVAGFRVFSTYQEFRRQLGARTRREGASLSFGFPLSEDGNLSLSYSVTNVDYFNPFNNVHNRSRAELEQVFGYGYTIDKRDDFINPTRGWNFSFGQGIAGPAGEVSFLRFTMRANFYQQLAEGYVLHLRGTFGNIHDYKGGIVERHNRFLRGAGSFRGFDFQGVGPRDLSNNVPLGANRYFIGTTQVSLPLGIPKEAGMRANAFIDFGWLGDTGLAPSTIVADELAFRATYGLSVSWRSPLGPIQFDWGWPIVKEDYDETRRFRFTIGTSF